MAQVLIRNIDDRIVETFKLRAKLKGHSLEQELRDVITRAAPLTAEERVASSDRIAAMTSVPVATPSEDFVRQGRDRKS